MTPASFSQVNQRWHPKFIVQRWWSPPTCHIITAYRQRPTSYPCVWPTHRRTPRFPCLITSKTHERWCWETQRPPSPCTHLRREGCAHPPHLCFRRRNMPAQNSLGDGTVYPASVKEAFSEDTSFYHLLGTLNMHVYSKTAYNCCKWKMRDTMASK